MEVVRQPQGSSLCGQACVAMLCGISLEQAIKEFGSKGRTTASQLASVLVRHGYMTGSKAIRHYSRSVDDLPRKTLIVKFTSKQGRHWVLYRDGKWYDPAVGVFRKVPKYLVDSGARPTSYVLVGVRI